MNISTYRIKVTSIFAAALILSACGGSGGSVESDTQTPLPESVSALNVTDAAIIASGSKTQGGIIDRTASDFDFPAMESIEGQFDLSIPAGPAPAFAARRTILSGGGDTLGFGDPVTLKYDMFSWSDGTLVDSSSQYPEAFTVAAGDSDAFPMPDYLAKSLLGRSLGDLIQVILPAGTEDLPIDLDNSDAYVLVVELL